MRIPLVKLVPVRRKKQVSYQLDYSLNGMYHRRYLNKQKDFHCNKPVQNK